MAMNRRSRLSIVLLVAAAAGIAALVLLTRPSASVQAARITGPTEAAVRASSSEASAAVAAAAPDPGLAEAVGKARIVDGVVMAPDRIQRRIDALNASLDTCLLAHGARRVPLEGRGWSYDDPTGVAYDACGTELAESNAYPETAEYRAAIPTMHRTATAWWSCLAAAGIDGGDPALLRSAPALACAVTANAAA